MLGGDLVVFTLAAVLAGSGARPYDPPPLPRATPPRPPSAPAAACLWPCASVAWETRAPVIAVNGAGVEGAAAGVIGDKIYVSQGYSFGDTSSLRIYDIPTDTWSLGPGSSPTPRSEGVGTVFGGKLYTFGGRSFDLVEIFDPVLSSWRLGMPMPTARKGTAVGVLGGLIHVVGGSIAGSGPNTGTSSNAHEVYDPAADSWATRRPLPVALGDVYASVVIAGRMYVFGGWDGRVATASTWIYDPAADTWTAGAAMPTPRSNAIAGVLAGRAVVIGGYSPALGGNLDVVEAYDPAADSWCTAPPKPAVASELGSALTYTASAIYAIGSGALGASRPDHEALVLAALDPPRAEASAGGAPACAGATLTLDGTASSGCASGYTYRWLDGATVVCDWSPSPTCVVAPATSRTYTLEVACAGHPDCVGSAEVAVTPIPYPLAVLGAAGPLCAGGSTDLDASSSDPQGCPVALEYQFRDGATVLRPWAASPSFGPLAPGASTTYTVDVRCTATPGCQASTTQPVTVVPFPDPALAVPSPVCAGEVVVLDASASDLGGCPVALLYRFRDGATVLRPLGPSPRFGPFAPAASTTYAVDVRCPEPPGCERSVTRPLALVPRPRAVAGSDRAVCAGIAVTLDGSGSSSPGCPGGALFEWRQGATVLRPADPSPTWQPPTSQPGASTYTLVLSCAALPGCAASDDVLVTVSSCPLSCRYRSYQAAIAREGGHAEIAWSTAEEDGTLGFAIERAASPAGPFVALPERVRARGAGADYRLLDPDPPGPALPWYRVVELTDDGRGDQTPPFQATAASPGPTAPGDGRSARRERGRRDARNRGR